MRYCSRSSLSDTFSATMSPWMAQWSASVDVHLCTPLQHPTSQNPTRKECKHDHVPNIQWHEQPLILRIRRRSIPDLAHGVLSFCALALDLMCSLTVCRWRCAASRSWLRAWISATWLTSFWFASGIVRCGCGCVWRSQRRSSRASRIFCDSATALSKSCAARYLVPRMASCCGWGAVSAREAEMWVVRGGDCEEGRVDGGCEEAGAPGGWANSVGMWCICVCGRFSGHRRSMTLRRNAPLQEAYPSRHTAQRHH